MSIEHSFECKEGSPVNGKLSKEHSKFCCYSYRMELRLLRCSSYCHLSVLISFLFYFSVSVCPNVKLTLLTRRVTLTQSVSQSCSFHINTCHDTTFGCHSQGMCLSVSGGHNVVVFQQQQLISLQLWARRTSFHFGTS